jgi:HlyD family secretion protein
MFTRQMTPRMSVYVLAGVLTLGAGCSGAGSAAPPAANGTVSGGPAASTAAVSGAVRLSGTVEAVRSRTITVPRLAGTTLSTLLITKMLKGGSRVKEGDIVVVFDQQAQQTAALDRQAEVVDLEGQIKRRLSEQAATLERDTTEITTAENDVERAKLDLRKNEFVGKTEAEKNTLAFEQATAKLAQLKQTFQLKRKAAAADLRILEIRKERAERNMGQAQKNAELMVIQAPFAGLIVTRSQYRPGSVGQVDVQEGDEVRPGLGIVSIVDTSSMLVRARLNQADIGRVQTGQPAKVRLDGFPELLFDGRVELVTPLAMMSEMSLTVRTFTAVIAIQGTHDQLLPDLTASVEILPMPAPRAAAGKAGSR